MTRPAPSNHECLDAIEEKPFLMERLISRLFSDADAIRWGRRYPFFSFAADGAMALDFESLACFVDLLVTQGRLHEFLGVAIRDTATKAIKVPTSTKEFVRGY